MIYGIWLSADALSSQQVRQDVIANNLTQVDTPGFKPDRVAFGERLNQFLLEGNESARYPGHTDATGGLFPTKVYTDFQQGRIIPTDNKLDVALLDDGFFSVGTSEGVRYTRDGRFTMRLDGSVEHIASGGSLLDSTGNPIVLNPNDLKGVSIGRDGRVRQGDADIARLGTFRFENPQSLEKAGENLYQALEGGATLAPAQVRQGAIEASGADPALTLADMIAASRAYEMSASMIRIQDESLGRLVNDVGRVA